jgi:hypothetical protein
MPNPNPNPTPPRRTPLLALILGALMLFHPSSGSAQTLTRIQHVFLILMENVTWPQIKGNTNAAFINDVLLPMSSYCDHFFTPPGTRGSLAQYLWLEAGTNFGINDGDPVTRHLSTTNHLVIQLQNAGITWKTYQENISGSDCPTASSGLYFDFHNPYIYFDDIYLDPVNCSNHVRPYPELAGDLTSNTVPRYCFITPNLCNDMHNSSGCATPDRIRNGDNWLAAEIPKILNSEAYQNNGAIIITWDEGTDGVSGPFGTIVISPLAKGGAYLNTNRFDHSATLRTIQEIFGVRPFLVAAAASPSLQDLFLPDLPRLESPRLETNTFSFTVNGLNPGQTNWIQYSTNLVNWRDLITNVAESSTFNFRDTVPSNSPFRFYRLLDSQSSHSFSIRLPFRTETNRSEGR